MDSLHDVIGDVVSLYLTVEDDCNYLPQRMARDLVAMPAITEISVYTQLARFGFRRSGDNIYRPHCRNCVACRSLRIPVAQFKPNRIQRRVWAGNRDLQVRSVPADFQPEHFELFTNYIRTRHHDGGMESATPIDYCWTFIDSEWCNTELCEFRLADGRLVAVAVIDRLDDGLSAVYTFFDAAQSKHRSLGTLAVLWQIAEAQRLGLEWVYLGYWVEGSAKMAYKNVFNPHQLFIVERGEWVNA